MTNEELATAIQAGNNDLMENLWRQCYGFIRQQSIKWARSWQNRPDFDVDDFIQSGYIALCEAVRCFEDGRSSFINYLSFYLKTEFSKVAGCYTDAQLKAPLNNAISLDSPAYKDAENETTIGDNIPCEEAGFDEVEGAVFNEQLAKALDKAMEKLTEEQRTAIELRFYHGKTFFELAEIFHSKEGYPKSLIDNGLRKMRHGKSAVDLSEMLYGDRNYFKHTGFTAWKESGSSSPEWELLKKEERAERENIRYCVDSLGMKKEQAKRIITA